ncbi:putative protein isoform X2 [Capsicum chacoense]
MAYAAVTSLISTLGLLLQSNSCLVLPPKEQTKSLHKKVKEQIQSFHKKLRLLQECLETLEKNINDRKAFDRCEGKNKAAAHDAEERLELQWNKFMMLKMKRIREKLIRSCSRGCNKRLSQLI